MSYCVFFATGKLGTQGPKVSETYFSTLSVSERTVFPKTRWKQNVTSYGFFLPPTTSMVQKVFAP